MSLRRTYLDWNANAPLRPEARLAMLEALDVTGNPSSVHAEGRRARGLIEDARAKVARLVCASPEEVIFTSGATEANNTVIMGGWDEIWAADVEHDSVLGPISQSNSRRRQLGIDVNGRVRLTGAETFAQGASPSSAEQGRWLTSLQRANNETGVLQPVAEVAAWAKTRGHAVHTDATQAVGRIAVDMRALGVDYLSCSAHKIGGPKGVGALVARDGAHLKPLMFGGSQEQRRRAGTENLGAIAGFGAAAEAAMREIGTMDAIGRLRDRLECEVRTITPRAQIIGAGVPRLANTSLIALPGRSAETLVAALDLEGVAVSSGAACASGKVTPSHVLAAMGLGAEFAKSAVRVSLGATTTEDDIAAFCAAWSRTAKLAARAA